MDEKTFDRSLLIPIMLAVFSVAGIVLLLLGLRISSRTASPVATPTSSPQRFQFLATEPGVVTLPPEGTPTPTLSPTAFEFVIEDTPTVELVEFPTLTPVFVGSTVTPTATALALSRTYDDVDFALNYSGSWLQQSGVNGVYQNTLHLSNTIGDAMQLSFVGQKIRLVYQAGPGLGTVAIKLDSADFTLNQTSAETQIGQWESPILALSSHTVAITHISGGAVNIDSLVVVDISTPTPTLTATP